jgi:hypothetical protein
VILGHKGDLRDRRGEDSPCHHRTEICVKRGLEVMLDKTRGSLRDMAKASVILQTGYLVSAQLK